MPLYIYDFVQCQYRIEVFTLDQSLNILNLIDWLLLSIIVIIIICLLLQNIQRYLFKFKEVKNIGYWKFQCLHLQLQLRRIVYIQKQWHMHH
ncbi:hypothetical protein FGO68_gene9032 [Halteria grandinella]|uniref:Transmembrane protein n=1 Tax=Halteria grandinella TaxID=5974 RepID=A0A8J8SX48_HALGN|nr:hypothetical protein FGO68_gene9032 [Halteria grandinella]